jgi:predicted GIY-YIG superfamily endonuclease
MPIHFTPLKHFHLATKAQISEKYLKISQRKMKKKLINKSSDQESAECKRIRDQKEFNR